MPVLSSKALEAEVPASTSRAVMKKLISRRIALGLSQYDVAARVGWSQAMVSRWETSRLSPRLADVECYARAVGLALRVRLVAEAEGERREIEEDHRGDQD